MPALYSYMYEDTPNLNDQVRPLEYTGNERQWRAACGKIALVTNYTPIGQMYDLLFDPKVICFDNALWVRKTKQFNLEFDRAVDELIECGCTYISTDRRLHYRAAIARLLHMAYKGICSNSFYAAKPSKILWGSGLDGRYDEIVKAKQCIEKIFSDLGMRKQK